VLRTYGEGFAGREAELAALDRAWNDGRVRVFVLHAEGGAGKTRVVARWLTQLRDDGWRGAGRVFVHSFYSQGSDERRNASSELFFEQALSHFGHIGPRLTDPTEQGRTLARLLIEQNGLLVLDGLESLQYPLSFDQGRLKDPAIRFLLLSLAAGRVGDSSGRGLCMVTSRQSVQELQDKGGRLIVQQPLDRLDAAAGVELLRQLEVRGPKRELREAVENARGHAYSLTLLGTYLRDATADHEIRRRREIPLLAENKEHRYHARHLFGAYVPHLGESSPEVAVLRLLGFFDRPAEEKLLVVLREADESELNNLSAPLRNLSEADWRRVLRRLTNLRLIDLPVSPSPLIDSHPLLRDHFAEQLRSCFPDAWRAGHRWLFEHLCETTEHRPGTLAGLQPLYQAVVHGCLAGLHERALYDVYVTRILRGTGAGGFFSRNKFGAIGADLGAVTNFFVMPWNVLAPSLVSAEQAWLLIEAATCLRALGRLTEAVKPMRAGVETAVMLGDWKNAAQGASNLSELELTRGEVSAACNAGDQSVWYADLSRHPPLQTITRTTFANALHQAGRRNESYRQFEDAETRQSSLQPQYPLLYSQGGFRYCDLLLADAERAAWQSWLDGSLTNPMSESFQTSSGSIGEGANVPKTAACDIVNQRATTILGWRRLPRWNRAADSLLDIALEHLVLARAALYKAHSASCISCCLDYATSAVKGLRAAGQLDNLPRGLLTRAWLRCLSGDEPGCREDLDEAWEIAERGPMPLFQADIQLTRARLFHDRAALAEARRLIEKHGYHRRDEELADAEAAAQSWGENETSQQSGPHQLHEESKSNEDSMRDQVFISYSHRDEKLMQELLIHLKPFLRSGSITAWSDKQIASGSQWFDEIQGALSKTSVAVLLVSPTFLASDFIHEHELGPLLKEAQTGGVRLLWIQIRACAYEETPLAKYQAVVSPPDKPLAEIKSNRDQAWVRVCTEIKKAVALPATSSPGMSAPATAASSGSALRVWQEKLEYLLEQEAITVDPDQKFRLRKLIEEARQKIRELGGHA
jgi:hypothetical protein